MKTAHTGMPAALTARAANFPGAPVLRSGAGAVYSPRSLIQAPGGAACRGESATSSLLEPPRSLSPPGRCRGGVKDSLTVQFQRSSPGGNTSLRCLRAGIAGCGIRVGKADTASCLWVVRPEPSEAPERATQPVEARHRPFPARDLASARTRNVNLIRARGSLHPGVADGQNRGALQARIGGDSRESTGNQFRAMARPKWWAGFPVICSATQCGENRRCGERHMPKTQATAVKVSPFVITHAGGRNASAPFPLGRDA
jgi:hypothetical protein